MKPVEPVTGTLALCICEVLVRRHGEPRPEKPDDARLLNRAAEIFQTAMDGIDFAMTGDAKDLRPGTTETARKVIGAISRLEETTDDEKIRARVIDLSRTLKRIRTNDPVPPTIAEADALKDFFLALG